ncbi:MAG: ACT domain-containing protein [Anaerolineae bacterium]|nr:ACT domain-containing protein [Anaerolineae bacterium]
MSQTVQQVLRQASFYSDDQLYRLIRLPAAAITAAAGVIAEIGEPFAALIVDKDEVTLLVPEEAWADFSARLPGAESNPLDYRLITLDLPLEPDLVGLLAVVSAAIAAAAVPILAYGAYSRDHFFVPAARFTDAMSALEQLRHRE